MTKTLMQKWFVVLAVATLFVALWLSDWLHPLGLIFKIESIRFFKAVLNVVLDIIGLFR